MISKNYKFIFVHVPRTGGTSIEFQGFEKELGVDEEEKHWSLDAIKQSISHQQFAEYFKFSFVRNPWDIVISKYCSPFYRDIGLKTNKSLLYFLHNYYIPDHEYGDLFHDYFDPAELDYIGRFETRAKDLKFISQKIGRKLDPNYSVKEKEMQKALNNQKHYTEYYDDETRQIVAERYARDIERFGYKFEG